MQRISLTSPFAALLALALAACSGDDQGSATDTTTTGGTTTGGTTTGGTTTGGTETSTSAASETTDGTASGTTSGTTSDTTTGDPGFQALCEKTAQESLDGQTALCECQVAAGEYADVAECLAMSIGTDLDIACECGVYAKFPDQVAFLECAAPLLSEVAACLATVDCTDPFAIFGCYDLFADSECQEPSDAADLESDKVCYGKVPFMCESGEEIPAEAACDGFPDCEDESDEAECPVFQCKSGEEIPLQWKCDGEADCRDGSDEADCP